ncbi:MAG: alpha/beta hydrolase [Chloroflexi bacterium]|nr:alpha/beta hydrolase [Chloroflexota bacterium]
MKHEEGAFKGVRNASIYYQAWLPEGKVKAVLLLVHGLGEHCGRYAHVAERFTPSGYAIYGLDHIGHGKSEGGREVVDRFEDFTANLAIYHNMVKAWQPGKPVFLYGHSLGGLISTYYLLDRQSEFKGAIISAPPVKIPANVSPMTVTMGRALSILAPKAGVLGLDTSGLSRDPQVVQAYVNDPLVFHGKTPARLAAEMLRAMQAVTAGVGKITLPFIVIQGSADRLVDPSGAQMLHEQAGSSDKTLRVYDGLYHEVHNEPERETMFKDLEAWLKAHD